MFTALLVYTSLTTRLILIYTLLYPPTKSICSPMFPSPGRFCSRLLTSFPKHATTPIYTTTTLWFIVTFPSAVPSLHSTTPLCRELLKNKKNTFRLLFFLSPGGSLICLSYSPKIFFPPSQFLQLFLSQPLDVALASC